MQAQAPRLGSALGTCPTAEHVIDSRQCGFSGCVDLRVWAKAHRYRYRLEESYKAEQNAHVKGDGRWFVEIRCRYGLIYPYGGEILIAYASPDQTPYRGARRNRAPSIRWEQRSIPLPGRAT